MKGSRFWVIKFYQTKSIHFLVSNTKCNAFRFGFVLLKNIYICIWINICLKKLH
uniref:Uncharacterized protein n=1 Tax=Anguilla anguilla TaxID=7936 RepID=A0A0E9V488_ANGAN